MIIGLLLIAFVLSNGVNSKPQSLQHAKTTRTYKDLNDTTTDDSNHTMPNRTTDCSTFEDHEVKPPYPNVWADFTHAQAAKIYDWLIQPSLNLNLTDPKNATVTDNYVWLIEKLHTNKSSVIPYIDSNGTMPMPNAYARVVIIQNGQSNPVVQEYMVGPIPICSNTTIRSLDYIYHRNGTVPFNAGLYDRPRMELYDITINKVMCGLQDITLDLFGYVYCNEKSNITYEFSTPFSKNGSKSILWIWFQQKNSEYWNHASGARTILPVGFQLGIDVSGTDPSLHKVIQVVYSDQFFSTVDAFVEAYHNSTLVRAKKPNPDTRWASPERKNSVPVRPLDDKTPPVSLAPEGKRYKISEVDRYVEWMDWSFFMVQTRDLSTTLYDIKFKGKRIIYELGIQEAVAQYAGYNPVSASTAYLDRYYGFGEWQFELVEGYDVPYGSTMLNTTYHKAGETVTNKNSLAVFEIDTGMPMQRHTYAAETEWTWTQTLKGPVLTVRSISTVGNYDYILDYNFHLDGTIESKLSASGYLQAMFDTAMERDYGHRIHEVLNSGIHTHLISYKVDLDIEGRKNSFQKVNLLSVEEKYPFFEGTEQETLNTFKLQREWVTNENSSRMGWPTNMQGVYLIANQDAKNSWGEIKSYRFMPGYPGATAPAKNSTFLLKNAQWSKYNVAVSVQKDTEPSSSATLNQNLPWDPLVDFDKFFDGESLTQKDLVVWITIGMHHFPNTQDIPTTLFRNSRTSFLLTPFNYFDREQSNTDSINGVYISKEKEGKIVNNYGQGVPDCPVDKLDLSAFIGEPSAGVITAEPL